MKPYKVIDNTLGKIAKKMVESKKISYEDVVKQWHQDKKKMSQKGYKNPIRRWDEKNPYQTFENAGKTITDTNPYINLVDVDAFELYVENEGFPLSPPPLLDPSGIPDMKEPPHPFLLLFNEGTGNPLYYMLDMMKSWRRTEREKTKPPKYNPVKESNLDLLKKEIISFSKDQGFVSVGVTKVDRRYISLGEDDQFIFENIILLGYEMPKKVIERYPKPEKEFAAFGAYTGCAINVHKVADMIRSKGYDCRTLTTKGEIKYPPLAVNAGLGNFSTYGVCVTPEAGTRLKYCAILIDADIKIDMPKDYNIEEFCSRCRMCQKSCPTHSIPKEESYYRGAIKRQTRYMNCLEMMVYDKECLKCIRVCPFSMVGYDKCMDALPAYYQYNLDDERILRGDADV